MVTRRDYTQEKVDAARTVLIELTRVLGQYRDRMVLVGGSVPPLQFPNAREKHIGSMDVDLALDHRALDEPGYGTILRLLLEHGYTQDNDQPFRFFRKVCVGGVMCDVEVDLLAGEYEGTGAKHRTQKVQDVRARKARGCDLVFSLFDTIRIEGALPDGSRDSAEVRVASVVSFLVTKANALKDRMKQKDAYDIDYCLKHYPGGLQALADAIRPHADRGLVREALLIFSEKYTSPKHSGPTWVADFYEQDDAEERAITKRACYERMNTLLELLGARGIQS